jgi:hypothetical protein
MDRYTRVMNIPILIDPIRGTVLQIEGFAPINAAVSPNLSQHKSIQDHSFDQRCGISYASTYAWRTGQGHNDAYESATLLNIHTNSAVATEDLGSCINSRAFPSLTPSLDRRDRLRDKQRGPTAYSDTDRLFSNDRLRPTTSLLHSPAVCLHIP